MPGAEAAALDADILDSSESAFHLGMLIGAVLMALGGVISLLGVRNPEHAAADRAPVPGPGSAATAGECGRSPTRPAAARANPSRASRLLTPVRGLDSLRVRIFSGIQPTGRKHLGNYIGAIRQYVEGQERAEREGGESIYCIVDLHAISVAYDPAELRERLYDTTAILLAAGPRPGALHPLPPVRRPRAHRAHAGCSSAVTAHGDLNRMTQFKEKSAKQRELVSAALFLYPVLQAADVLAYKADEVPVGDDQRQHIELMREIARRFNERFGPTRRSWSSPSTGSPRSAARIMDLQDPTVEDVDHRRHRAGHGAASSTTGGRRAQEGDERGHRLRLGGRAAAPARTGSRT